jgi:hypothetical protein
MTVGGLPLFSACDDVRERSIAPVLESVVAMLSAQPRLGCCPARSGSPQLHRRTARLHPAPRPRTDVALEHRRADVPPAQITTMSMVDSCGVSVAHPAGMRHGWLNRGARRRPRRPRTAWSSRRRTGGFLWTRPRPNQSGSEPVCRIAVYFAADPYRHRISLRLTRMRMLSGPQPSGRSSFDRRARTCRAASVVRRQAGVDAAGRGIRPLSWTMPSRVRRVRPSESCPSGGRRYR